MEPILEVKNLFLSYFTPTAEIKAVNGVTFTLDKGEILGIAGESGCGKSALANSIIGLVKNPGRIIGGNVLFKGKDIINLSKRELQKLRGRSIALVFQDPMTALNPVFTVGSNFRELLKLYYGLKRGDANAEAVKLLKAVNISDPEQRLKQYPYELSGGIRQRVLIAIALCGNPEIIVADEPTSALDVTVQAQIIELLLELKQKENISMAVISHDLRVIRRMADRVIIMYGGKIMETAPTDELFGRPAHPYTKALLNSISSIESEDMPVPIYGVPAISSGCFTGCPFAPRCSKCMKVCIDFSPPAVQISENHSAACWLFYAQRN